MLKGLFQFLKSKVFFLNLFLYVALIVSLFWYLITWLNNYTSHGKTFKVPDFNSVKVAELDQFISDKNVRYQVIDSIYNTKAKKGTVVKQEPEPGTEVKEGRIVYLYVTSIMPPNVQMPKLVDRSLRQAITMISTYGCKLGKIEFVADQCANCVLEQLVKGLKIEPGTNISKGTVINLVVGRGRGGEEVGIPCLYGLTGKEAMERLAEASLNVGAVIFDLPKDSMTAVVYKQSPTCGKRASINLGSSIDLFLSADKNKSSQVSDTTSSSKDDDTNFDD